MEKFNHHMMTLARDSREMTQAQLASALSAAQGTLSKYENGLQEPPRDFVAALGSQLNYPPTFFYQQGSPYGFPPFHYRKRKKLSQKVLGRIVAEMNIRRMHVHKLASSAETKSNKFIPEVDFDEYQGAGKKRPTIEDVARSVREAWMVPPGPIENMVRLIEDNGGIVIPCDFGSDLIDAMSQRIDGMPVLFFVNINSPADRVRMTLAHELAHMVMHTTTFKDDDEMEKEADEFAGAFLLPANEIKVQLRKFDLRHLANMKSYWKVSMAAIAVRAERLNLITPYQSKMFWIEMSKLGYRKREPNEPPGETPLALLKLVNHHRHALDYDDDELAELLCLDAGEFHKLYGVSVLSPRPKKAHLRVIK